MTVANTEITLTHKGRTFTVNTGLFIGNKFVPSIAGNKFTTVDPATGEPICEVYEALKEDVIIARSMPFVALVMNQASDSYFYITFVSASPFNPSHYHFPKPDLNILCPTPSFTSNSDAAVTAAKKGFKAYSELTPYARGLLIQKLADLMERDIDTLAALESWDNGKVFTEARYVDLPKCISTLRYYAGWADKLNGKVVDMDNNHHTYTRLEPWGVVGQIMYAWKLGPALCTGNAIVMKTSEKTPLSALKVCELIVEAGFPAGVVNVLSGFGPTAGEAIARHMEISKVAFTGSTNVGRKVMVAAATSNLKKVSLELGGKSPNIVFNDADLDTAVAASKIGFTLNHGQCCCAGTRVYVQEGVYDAFVAKLKAAASEIKLGGQFDDGANHGPLVDELQFNRVMGYIEDGKKAGAKVELGGERHGDKGYFVQPTIFSEVNEDMKVVREEIFGPVVCVMKFKTEEEIVERANNSNYGLAAAIHTKNLSVAHRVASKLQAGTIWVNTYNNLSEQLPFGGYKESGIGRENGEYAIHEYTQVKAVYMNLV
ncbi:aldehyde dehydrogenase (NAD(P)(+)) ald5 [Phlyctochytrium planicorne]|nr:aldehyde dehydrogenase (NAD(P)(+)) ald5 [Phlyctochytrium planicorne]